MREADPQIFSDEEIKQGWHASPDKYKMRIADQEKGDCLALTAEYKGAPAGYINVYWNPPAGAFANRNIPEIVDFGVLEKYRCRGIGRRLMDIAEKLAKPVRIPYVWVWPPFRLWQRTAHVCKKRLCS